MGGVRRKANPWHSLFSVVQVGRQKFLPAYKEEVATVKVRPEDFLPHRFAPVITSCPSVELVPVPAGLS